MTEVPENVKDYGLKAVLLHGMFDMDAVSSVSNASV